MGYIGYYKLTVDSEKTMVASYDDSYCDVTFSLNILKVCTFQFICQLLILSSCT